MSHELTQEELDTTFPLVRAERPGTFEIGFALAGTVSAGAYTAGVLDYIMEALDAWEAAKLRGDPEAPTHRVTLSTLVGASGGALNGAIFLRAAGSDFPRGAQEGNPFYDAWVGPNSVTIDKLLSGASARSPGVTSLVDTAAIERAIQSLIGFEGKPLPSSPDGATPPQRGYLADPLRLVVTMSNLIGTPYRVGFTAGPNIGFDFWRHDDTARFALHVDGGDAAPGEGPRIGEMALSSVSGTNWDRLKAAALATCAFPLVFSSRDVLRSPPEIAARVALVSQPGGDPRLPMTPRWDLIDPWLTRNPSAPMVDGGLTNNEPIGLTHTELAGLAGVNDRESDKATRALILVDPFVASNKMPDRPATLPGLAGLILSIFLNQSRYRAEDILSAVNSKVFSRFLIAPGPEGAGGESSLASGGLHAFGGFLDTALLKHDFLLGRYNAFQFLTLNFRFDPANPLLSEEWTPSQIATHTSGIYVSKTADPAEAGFVPMIPLMASLRDENNQPKKPVQMAPLRLSEARRKQLGVQIEARLDYLYKTLKPSGGMMASAWSTGFGLLWPFARRKLRKDILSFVRDKPGA
ncbi:Patatin-like phospholipase [Kaistia soli DSM 19436]|uniref:Patatin-like phospholipase n=1 Tax=Kaistia soli DSM 19436 TaxID=1122133 RepID=A0A1M5DF71_9HYPH|nr:patatin-like phospholipase family protein [Kaistia soli]SHF65565.1 Patatin-like phospholipase [Kaistia soli DSM 19436]